MGTSLEKVTAEEEIVDNGQGIITWRDSSGREFSPISSYPARVVAVQKKVDIDNYANLLERPDSCNAYYAYRVKGDVLLDNHIRELLLNIENLTKYELWVIQFIHKALHKRA